MKKYLLCLAVSLFMALPAETVHAAPVTIKFAHGGSLEHQYNIGAELFKKFVEEASNKEIVVQVFPQGQLGSERDAIEGVRMGTVEMAAVAAAGPLPSFVPEMGVLGLPYVLQSRKQAYAVLDGHFGQELNALIAAKNLINLCYWEVGFRHFTTNTKPIKTPADLKDMKIRVQESKVWMEFIKLFGGVPTPIPFGELYSALQQKVIDGQENPIATIYSMRYFEVQKYLVLDGHTYEAAAVLINPGFFKKLSEKHRDIVVKAAEDARAAQRAKLEQLEAERIDAIKKAGVVIEENPDLAAFSEATKDFYKNLDTIPEALALKFKEAATAVR